MAKINGEELGRKDASEVTPEDIANNHIERGKMMIRANRDVHVHIMGMCIDLETDNCFLADLPPGCSAITVDFYHDGPGGRSKKHRMSVQEVLDKIKKWAGAINPLRPQVVKS